jgi:ABC-type phosphate/phosphonate transport system substrate-binding protein
MTNVLTRRERARRSIPWTPGRLLSAGVFWLATLGLHPLALTAAETAGVAPESAGPIFRPSDNPPAEFFNVGITRGAFRNVNPNDAAAAYTVFLETIGRRHGQHFKASTQIFDDPGAFETMIRGGSLHLSVVGAWDYLSMHIDDVAKPSFAVTENGQVGRRYLILTRRDSGLNALPDLRGKSLVKLDYASVGAALHWLDTLLAAGRLGSQERFFGSVEVVGKPSAAVLPVFFGKKSACVVDESSFKIMKELNPQVGLELQVVAISERFADILVCVRERGWPSDALRAETMQALTDLPQDPGGRQILTLFKIDHLVPFRDEYLDTIRQLRAAYAKLKSEDEQ